MRYKSHSHTSQTQIPIKTKNKKERERKKKIWRSKKVAMEHVENEEYQSERSSQNAGTAW